MGENVILQLIESFGEDIYRFCFRLAMNREDADDLYQDTFLKALEKSEQLIPRNRDSLTDYNRRNRNYLMGIAANLWKNQWRKQKKARNNISIEYADWQDSYLASSENIQRDFEQREIQRRLTLHIEALPEKLKIVVCMYYTAEMKIEEIANTLHIPQGTVKSRLYLARTKLKNGLEADGYEI